jgi:hypothetical protein
MEIGKVDAGNFKRQYQIFRVRRRTYSDLSHFGTVNMDKVTLKHGGLNKIFLGLNFMFYFFSGL